MSSMKAVPLAELLPQISGLLSKEAFQSLTEKKQSRPEAVTRTTIKPRTIAELQKELLGLRVPSPRRYPAPPSTLVKKWNSSIKVDKKSVSHLAKGTINQTNVKKVLNFQQPKTKTVIAKTNSDLNAMNPEIPRLPKPKPNIKLMKKSMLPEAHNNNVRFSGIYHLSQTPQCADNKENNKVVSVKKQKTPSTSLRMKLLSQKFDSPLSNRSSKSSCDESFLRNEAIQERFIDNGTKALAEEQLENFAKISPPVSTPFKEYKNVNQFFNNSSDVDNSAAYHDNTIMNLDKSTFSAEIKQDESVIVSLRDQLNKATIKLDLNSTDVNDLPKLLQRLENYRLNNKAIIDYIYKVDQEQLQMIKYMKSLIQQENKRNQLKDNGIESIQNTKDVKTVIVTTPKKVTVVREPQSILKSCLRSPSYKIPKKNQFSLKKKVLYKSMPNACNNLTPPQEMGEKALKMYAGMKRHMTFLQTPLGKQKPATVPDTPAIMSYNLQKQLGQLYRGG